MLRLRVIGLAALCLTTIFNLSGCAVTEAIQGSKVVGNGNVSLTVPADIVVESIDGIAIESPSLYTGEYQVRLTPGNHTLALYYAHDWSQDMQYLKVAKSQSMLLTQVFTASGSYRIDYEKPASYEEAIALKNNANIWITEGGIRQTYQIVTASAVTPATRIVSEPTAISKPAQPASTAPKQAKPIAPQAPLQAAKMVKQPTPSPLVKPAIKPVSKPTCDCDGQRARVKEMLEIDNLKAIKKLWKRLTPEERKAFWISIAPN